MKKFAEFRDQIVESQDQQRIFGDLLCNVQDSSLYYTDTNASFTLPRLKMDEILKSTSNIQVNQPCKKKSFKVLENGKKISRDFCNQIHKLVKKPKSGTKTLEPVTNLAVWDHVQVKSLKKRKLKASRGGEYLKEEEEVKKPKLPGTLKAGIEISGPGASYNPQKNDHEQLIQEAYKEELDKIAQKEKILEKLEYSKELDDLSDDMTKEVVSLSDSSSEDVDGDKSKLLSRKRKTRSERNKTKKQEEKRKNLEKENQQKKLLKDINKIQEIQKELSNVKPKVKKNRDISKVTLGPLKFKKESMDVQLSDEISDNLRKFKPEGNLFKDRFKALQKNQMIETRLPLGAKAAKRKYRLKETESHDYKRFK